MARQAFSAHSIDCKSWRWKTPKILHGRVRVLNHDAMTTQPRRWSITLVHLAIEKILNGEEFRIDTKVQDKNAPPSKTKPSDRAERELMGLEAAWLAMPHRAARHIHRK